MKTILVNKDIQNLYGFIMYMKILTLNFLNSIININVYIHKMQIKLVKIFQDIKLPKHSIYF